ncbi:MAG TPA: hypothetical protein VM841_14155 [Actinomycetota bacterium]|nr:hypothetical protein [Actinomycetota bacterium]
MIVFPLIAALISAVFSFALFRQYRSRKRLSQLAWGVALAQYAIASVAVAAGIGGGWDPTLYRVYWVFGAMLNVPWLALGSIALLNKRAITLASLLMVVVGTIWGFVAVWSSSVEAQALRTEQIPKGSEVWCPDPGWRKIIEPCEPARGLARTYSLPSFAIVVGIAAVSGRKRDGVRPPRDRIRGNWIIAAGVTLNAFAGFALIGKGRGGPFSVVLALSVTVMFVGFVLASRTPRNVVLYVTPDCHLCEEPRRVLRAMRIPFQEVDAAGDPDRFIRTPILEVDGSERAEGPMDAAAVRRALRKRA